MNSWTTWFTVTPASIACTQLQPIRITTFAPTGSSEPRRPNAPRVTAMVGRPVRVPIAPMDVRTTAPTSVPTTIIVTAVGNGTAVTNSVPVSSVVTTRFAASQIIPIRAPDRVPLTGPELSASAESRASSPAYTVFRDTRHSPGTVERCSWTAIRPSPSVRKTMVSRSVLRSALPSPGSTVVSTVWVKTAMRGSTG